MDADGLLLQEQIERVRIAFTASSRVLDASERHVQVAYQERVNPNISTVQCASDPMSTAEILRPHGCCQAISRVVGTLNDFLLLMECGDANDRAKYLVLHQRRRVVQVGDYSWKYKVAIFVQSLWLIAAQNETWRRVKSIDAIVILE